MIRHLVSRYWRLAANLTVSVGVLSFLFYRFDGLDLQHRIAKADLSLLFWAEFILVALTLAHLARWRLILKQLGADVGLSYGLQLLFVGYFFNQTLPSSVGGDFSRIWLTNRVGVPLRISIASVVADRVLALLGILALCVALAPFIADFLGTQVAAQVGLVCLLFLSLGGIFIAKSDRIVRVFTFVAAFRHLAEMAECFKKAFSAWRLTATLIVLSSVAQFISGFSVFLIAKSLGVNISPMVCIALFPFINLVAVIPISFAGWGVRESVAISIFGLVGVSPEDSLSISILFGVALSIMGIPGGVLWLFRMHRFGFDIKNNT